MQQVLVVEDSPTVLKILRHLSSKLEFLEPVFASSFEQAKQLCDEAEHKFFASLADLNLPDAPNGELVDYLLEQGIPTLVLTGSFDEEKQTSLIQKGVVDYLLKEGRYSYQQAFETLNQLFRNRHTKVLVAEDSETARNHITGLLKRNLYQVTEAQDGVEALQKLQQDEQIKLLITDYQMPNMDGYELVQKIRHEMVARRISIIGLSSAENVTVSSRFIKNGADDFLHKPFSIEEFQCRVSHNLKTQNLLGALERAAFQDYLTQIPNRRFFISKAREMYQQAQSNQTQLACAVLDIDHFKRFNDDYGHEAGDEVLRQFGAQLKTSFKPFLFARTGGEEFTIMLPGLNNDQAYQLLDAFRRKVAELIVEFGEQDLNVSVSIGVSNQLGEQLEGLLHNADLLLYDAKSAGRNIVVGD